MRVLLPLPLLLLLGCGPCEDGASCAVDDGVFFAYEPAGWDGQTPLPALIFAHGWGGSPEGYAAKSSVRDPFSDAGVLLILPEGAGGGWDVMEGRQGRDEVAFIESVLDRAAEDWPVDTDRVTVGGFSLGASLAYKVGCEVGAARFAAVAPMSGGYWSPMPTECAGGPVPLRHVHGLADDTWPYDGGRSFGDGFTQTGAEQNVEMWRDHVGCGDAIESLPPDVETCTRWTECGVDVQLCTHEKGHTRVDGWGDRLADWMLQFER